MRALSPTTNRVGYAAALARRQPSLINDPGITHIEGVALPPAPPFDENTPLRDGVPLRVQLADGTVATVQSPVINTVAGAADIQQVLENHEWVEQWSNPVAYARHLRHAPLRGMTAKNVLFQFARSDQTVPNPLTSAMLRAGDLAQFATMYRHDLAWSERPALPKNPHGFAYLVSAFGDISRAAQAQIVEFLASGGISVSQPEPTRFFEVSISGALPEDLALIP